MELKQDEAGPVTSDLSGTVTDGRYMYWSVVARYRDRFPNYSALLPDSPQGAMLFQVGFTGLVCILGSVIIWSRTHTVVSGTLFVLAVCFYYVLGGVRRGQDNYAAEFDQTASVAALLAVDRGSLYFDSTSRPARLRIIILAAGIPVGLSSLAFYFSKPTLTTVELVAVAGLLPALAVSLRELISQASVVLRDLRIPKYVYLLAGIIMGAVGALAVPAFASGRTTDPAGKGAYSIVLVALTPVLECLAIVGSAIVTRRLAQYLCSGMAVKTPTLFKPSSQSRLTYLPARLWLARGRSNSSVIIGWSAIVSGVIFRLKTIGNLLPDSGKAPYERPEDAVILLYAITYFAAVLFQAPLEVRLIKHRTALLRLAGISPESEAWSLFIFASVPTAIVSLVVSTLLWHYRLIPNVPALTIFLAVPLLAIGAVSVVVLPSTSGSAINRARSLDEAPISAMMKSAGVFGSVMLAAGFEATHRHTTIQGATVGTLLILLAIGVALYTRRGLHHRFGEI